MPIDGMKKQNTVVSIFNITAKKGKYVIDIGFFNKKVSYEFGSSTLGLSLRSGISALNIEKGGSYPESLSPCQAEFSYYVYDDGSIVPIKLEISPATLVKFKAAGELGSSINITNASFKKGKRTLVYDVMPENLEGLTWARGPIHEVKDGDTFVMTVMQSSGTAVGQNIQVRLVGIDTTELSHVDMPELHEDSVRKNTAWLIAHNMKTDSENLKKNLELTYKHAAEAGKMIRDEFGSAQHSDEDSWVLAIVDDYYVDSANNKGQDMYGRYLCNVFFPIKQAGYSAISINKSMLASESSVIPGTALASPYAFISGNGAVQSRFPVATWWQFSFDYEKNLERVQELQNKTPVNEKEQYLKEHGLTLDADGTILYYGSDKKIVEIKTYVFKSGDTWNSIAEAFTNTEQSTSSYEILKENGLTGSFAAAAADTKNWIGKTIKVPIYKKFGNTYADYIASRYVSNVNDIPADCEADDYVALVHDDRDSLDGIIRTTPADVQALDDSGFLRIGDCTFTVPPISIRIDNLSTSRQVPTLRSKSSIQTQTGHTVRVITLKLFFADQDQINGYAYEMPELGETYYRNGLRPLVAQFKKAPFLPIENAVVNDTHQIYSVAFKDLQLNSVPGFPSCIEATLSLYEFDHLPYMPHEEYFAGTFNWKLFRWYYQRPMQATNKYMGRTYLETINTLDDAIRFFIPDENVLAQRQQSIKDLQSKIDPTAYAVANSDPSQEGGKQILDTAEFRAAKTEYNKFKQWLNRYPMPKYGRFYNSRGVFDPSELLTIPVANKQEKESYANALMDYFESSYKLKTKYGMSKGRGYGAPATSIVMDKMKFVPSYIDKIVRFLAANGYPGLTYNGLKFVRTFNTNPRQANPSIDTTRYSRFTDVGGYYVLDLKSTRNRTLTKDMLDGMFIISPTDIIKCKIIEFGEGEAKGSFDNYRSEIDQLNYMAHLSEKDVPVVEYNVGDIIITDISASMTNNLANMQLQTDDSPIFQYLGSQDIRVSIELAVLSKSGLRSLHQLMTTTQRLAREYRVAITSGVLTIKNNYLSLLGVSDFIIENMIVKTSERDKETYTVSLNLICFDKTQRLREDIDYVSIAETMPDNLESFEKFSSKKTSTDEGFEYGSVDIKLRELEIYPDLELPTYKEVNTALPFLNIVRYDGTKMLHIPNPTGAKFVDPDFYIRTSETYREYITSMLDDGVPAIVMQDDFGFEVTELGPDAGSTTMEKPNVNFSDDTKTWINNNLSEVDYGSLEKQNIQSYEGPLGTYNDYNSKIIQNMPIEKKGGPLETMVETVQDFVGPKNKSGRVNVSDREEINKYATCAKNALTTATGSLSYGSGIGVDIVHSPGTIFAEPTEAEMRVWFGGTKPISAIMKNPTPDEFTSVLYSLVKKYFGSHPSDLDKISKGVNCATYIYGADYISAPEITQEKITNVLKALFDYESSWQQFTKKSGKLTLNTNVVTKEKNEAFAVGIGQVNIINTGVNNISDARRAAWDWKYCLDLAVKVFAIRFNECVKSSGNERMNPLDYAIIRYNWPAVGNYQKYPRPIKMKYYEAVHKRFSLSGANAQSKGGGYGRDRAFWEATPNAVFDKSLMSQETAKNYIRNIVKDILSKPDRTPFTFSEPSTEAKAYEEKMNNPAYKNVKVLTIQGYLLGMANLQLRYRQYAHTPDTNMAHHKGAAMASKFNLVVFDTYHQFDKASADKELGRLVSGPPGNPLQSAIAEHFKRRFNKTETMFDYTSQMVVIKDTAYKAYKACGKFEDIPWNSIYKLVDIDSVEVKEIVADIREEELESYMYFNPDNIAEMYRSSFKDMLEYDQRGRLLRAFPTFQMFVIDEGRWMAWHKMWDNFYGYNSIVSIDVYKDRRMVADTAVIQMSNIYSNLTTHDTEIKYGEWEWKFSDLFFGTESEKEHVWNQLWGIPSEEILRARKDSLDSLVLKPGARIALRMGYGANAFLLPIVFNGTITEMDTQEIMTVVAQSDGIELTNKLNVQPDDTTDAPFLGGVKEPREMICDLLTSRGGYFKNLLNKLSNGVFFHTHPLGIVHFGNQILPKALLDGFDPLDMNEDYGEAGLNVYSGAGINTFSQWIYTQGPKKGEAIGMEWGSTPLPRFKGDEPNIKIYLFDKTPWDIFQTYAAVCPDYIAAVVPFEYRSTLFFGKPWWGIVDKYEYKYKWDDSIGAVIREPIGAYRKAFSQFRIYQSEIDIISNSIKATDEYLYTNVIGVYNEADGAKRTMPVQADSDIYPDKQTTALVHIPIQASWWGTNLWTQDKYALAAATSSLKDYMKEMYQGDLVVIGDPTVKPYDSMYISDSFADMKGNAEVKRVVHHFSFETGFISSISPDCVAIIDDSQGVSFKTWKAAVGATHASYMLGLKVSNKAWKNFMRGPIADTIRKYGANGAKFVLKDLLADSIKKSRVSKEMTEIVADRMADWIMSRGLDNKELLKRGFTSVDLHADDFRILRAAMEDSGIKAFNLADEVYRNIADVLKPIQALYNDPLSINKIVNDAWEKSGWLNNKYLFGAPKDIHEFRVGGKVVRKVGNLDEIQDAYKATGEVFEYLGYVGKKRNGLLIGIGNKSFKAASTIVKGGTKVGVKGTAAVIRGAVSTVKTFGAATIIGLVAEAGLSFFTSSVIEKYARYLRSRQAITIIPLSYRGKSFVAGINGHKGMVYGDIPSSLDAFFAGTGWGGGAMTFLYNVFSVDAPDYSGETTTEDLSNRE